MRDPEICQRDLWIDQICIDQNSNAEKSQQVKMMDIIFGRALKVFIWLGPATKRSDIAMKTVAGGPILRKATVLSDHNRTSWLSKRDDTNLMAAIEDLFDHPY